MKTLFRTFFQYDAVLKSDILFHKKKKHQQTVLSNILICNEILVTIVIDLSLRYIYIYIGYCSTA